jgi:hypothetical protein
MVAAVYGLSQGLGESYSGMSVDYFLKDELRLEPSKAQAFRSMTHIPWNIKPVRD